MSQSESPRADRLGEAIEAYLEHRARGHTPGDSLLEEHPTLQEWLSPMLAPAAGEIADMPDQGLDLLGDFRLVRERGRGGMGVVFEAVQQSLGRRVALKVLAAERTGSARSIERFRREASATAKLRHPSIVQVFGVGELAGRHVIAMEFVDGPNLAERLEQQRERAEPRIVSDDDDRSHVVQVADLVAQLADALAYAHQNGVVHRDVKPHNVLLQHDGTPKLVDFGVAKVVDAVSLSHTRELIGTPHYMSPEQASRGDASDPRSDVFSLGVVLYELLTFARPFDGPTADHVLAAIRSHDPERLRIRDPRIPRELELICEHALEKIPAERYPSAAAMAADLRSFLRHEPISVSAPGPLTRVRKLARRHRVLLSLITVTAVGLGVAYALAAEWRRAGVDAQREQTLRAERFAFDAVDKVLELLADELPRSVQSDAAARDRIRDAVRLYEEYLHDVGEQPNLRATVANALQRVAAVYRELGLLVEANAVCARSIALWQSLLAEDGVGALTRLALADAYRVRMRIAQRALDADAAREAYEADVSARRTVLAHEPGNRAALIGLGRTNADRGRGLFDGAGSLAEARAALEQARAIWTQIDAPTSDDPGLRLIALQTDTGLAYVEHRAGRFAEARTAFAAALAAAEADPKAAEPDAVEWQIQLAECAFGLGVACRDLGDRKAAVTNLRRALELQDGIRQRLPGRIDNRRRTIATRTTLGGVLLGQGDKAGAAAEFEPALAELRALALVDGTSTRAAQQLANLENHLAATCFRGSEPPDEAVFAHYDAAVEALEGALRDTSEVPAIRTNLGATFGNAAAAHLLRGELDPALTTVDRAIAEQRAAIAADPERDTARDFLRNHHLLRAQILLERGELDSAVRAIDASLDWSRTPKDLGPAAVVMDQCAAATTDAEARRALRERAAALRERAAAMRSGR
ncbi:MAG: serine/threonine protein kinase [Planctomycetes bacterium]|nr:serine/threonine protein kinase [Planctomycetota bacterium]